MQQHRGATAPSPRPGKSSANGLHRPGRKQSSSEPQPLGPGAAGEDVLLLDDRGGAASRACRLQVGEKSHWCLECGKAFGQKVELEMHQMKHPGASSYLCSDCGRSFLEHVSLAPGQGGCPSGTAASPLGSRRKGLSPPAEPAPQRKERKELSLQEKVRVLEVLEGPKVSQSELAKRFGVSQPQICRIIKNKERILAEWGHNANPGRKRRLEEKSPAGDRAFLQWFEWSCGCNFPSKGRPPLQEKASLGGDPGLESSLPWPNGSPAVAQGAPRRPLPERGAKDPLQEEEEEEEGRWGRRTLPAILSRYDLPDIYACEETGLFYKATPEDLAPERSQEGREQLTVLLCTNMDGSDKRDVLVVGKAARLLGCQEGDRPALPPASYRSHRRAWMTPTLFSQWLQEFNQEMKEKHRRVVLFVAQGGPHPYAELSNVRLVFLPSRPPWLRPLGQGVIQNFKCHYRRRLLVRLLVQLDSRASAPPRRLTLLDATHLVIQAWSEVCPQTIASSFRAAGFSTAPRLPTPPLAVVQALGCKDQGQFEQFALMDEGLECFDAQESAGRLQEHPEPIAVKAEDGEATDEPPSATCPSQAEVLESLAKVRRYLECHSVLPTTFRTFYQLEDLIHATALSSRPALEGKTCGKDGFPV